MLQDCNPKHLSMLIKDYWSPQVIASFDDYYIKVAKLKGSFTWHSHELQDEVFFILNGTLQLEYKEKNVQLTPGDLHVVPKGVLHNPIAEQECLVMLIEHKSTQHTGEIKTATTRSIQEQLSSFQASTNDK